MIQLRKNWVLQTISSLILRMKLCNWKLYGLGVKVYVSEIKI